MSASTRNTTTMTLSRVAGTLCAALLLGACSRGITSTQGDAPNLQSWMADVKARPAPVLDPLPVMEQFETFEYKAQGLRDPFSSVFEVKGNGSGPRPDVARRRQALEHFPLDSLDMVGTMGQDANIRALVAAPDKVTYKVKSGEYLGQSDGRVTAVYEDRIELVELVPDGSGGWMERAAAIALE